MLKPMSAADAAAGPSSSTAQPAQNKKRKRDERHKVLEQKKRKAVKKKEKAAALEAECEVDKTQWQHFSKKMTRQGKMTASIFASPHTVDGRVGVGTCGISGKPMTKWSTPASHLGGKR